MRCVIRAPSGEGRTTKCRRRAPNCEKPMVGVTIEKRAEILNHEPLQLRFAAQIQQKWHIQYPENLETSILGLGELEHMNKLYVSGMLQHIMNYNAGKASFTVHYSIFSYPQLATCEWPHSFLCPHTPSCANSILILYCSMFNPHYSLKERIVALSVSYASQYTIPEPY